MEAVGQLPGGVAHGLYLKQYPGPSNQLGNFSISGNAATGGNWRIRRGLKPFGQGSEARRKAMRAANVG